MGENEGEGEKIKVREEYFSSSPSFLFGKMTVGKKKGGGGKKEIAGGGRFLRYR